MHPALLQCPADTREERLAGPKVPSLPLRPSSHGATNHAPTRSNPPLWHLAAQPAPLQAQQHDLRAPQPDPHTSTARPASLTQHAQLTARRAQQRKASKLEKAESTRAITHPPPPAGPQEYTSDTAAFLAGCGGDIKGAVATGHRRLASIRSLFSFAHALGYVQFNHAASVDGAAATGGGKKGVWWRGGRSAAQAPPAFSSIHAGRPRVRSTTGPSGAARGGRMACRTRPPSSGPLKLAELPPPLNCGPKTPVFLLRSPLAFCRSTPAKHARARVQNLSRPARGAGRRGRTLGARAGPLQTSPTRLGHT